MSSVKGTFRLTTKRLHLAVKFARTALVQYSKEDVQVQSPERLKMCVQNILAYAWHGDKDAEGMVSKLKLDPSHWGYFCLGVQEEARRILSAAEDVNVPILDHMRAGSVPARWEIFESYKGDDK